MNALLSLSDRIGEALDRVSTLVLGTVARLVFAGTLLMYFWNAGAQKVGEGIFGVFQVTSGGFGQIFPKAAEQVLWNVNEMTLFQKAVVLFGTWAEFILPALIVLGLLTRLAALGMIGFVIIQSLTDLYGFGGIDHPETVGAWFDRVADSAILDQRAFWVLLFVVLVMKGAGPLSLDRLIRSGPSPHPVSQPQ